MTCPHCQVQLADSARFCPACGKAIAPTESQAGMPAMAEGPNMIGREIGARYRILAKLGEGGMGAVYRGEQISLKRACAIKLLRTELSANPMILRRFNAEAEVVAKLGHPNTVNIYDFGQDRDGSLFIAMEFIEGQSLRKVIHEAGPLPPHRALAIAVQVAASLADAHSHGIIHRDLKPDNVMMQTRGRQRDVARVLDFGIAKLRDDSRATQQAMTQAGDMLGTPQYMAPEQIRGEAIDGRTDVYALGCMLYEMITGRMPFDAPSVMAMLSKHLLEQPVPPSMRRSDLGLPPAIDQLVMAAMAKDPNARPPSMEQYGEHIAAVLATLPPDTNRPPSMPLSAVQGVASPPPLTPAAFSAYAPATPAPMVPTPMSAQMQAPPTARVKPANSHAALYAVLGAIVVCGGIGAFVALRSTSVKHADDGGIEGNSSAEHGSDVEQTPSIDAATAPTKDPWSTNVPASGDLPAPPPKTVKARIGTAETPLPKGARLDVPEGFVRLVDPTHKGIVYGSPTQNIVVGLGPLVGGTNDPDEIAAVWTKTTGYAFTQRSQIFSAGEQRVVAGFVGKFNGVDVRQIIVLYITAKYRLGLLIQAPTPLWDDGAFQQALSTFLASGVILP